MMVVPHVILTISSKLIDNINFVGNAGGTMRKLVLFGMVGVLAQLIDGALGMAYGLTSTTLLVAVGTAPAMASATVHLAELGTTAVSGVSHWRFGNVDWRTVRWMTFPGFCGAFLGGGGAVLTQRRRGQAVGGRHPQRPRCLRAVPVPRQAPRAPSPGRPAAPLRGARPPRARGRLPGRGRRRRLGPGGDPDPARVGPDGAAQGHRLGRHRRVPGRPRGQPRLSGLAHLEPGPAHPGPAPAGRRPGRRPPWPPGWSGAWPRASWA